MTDAEIIKALECCGSTTVGACKDCPMYKDKSGICVPIICRDAHDLINKQKAEIERLQKKVNYLKDVNKRNDAHLHVRLVGQAKSEARKEFVKKFEKKIKDVKFTLGQTWEIQCALKQALEEMGCD